MITIYADGGDGSHLPDHTPESIRAALGCGCDGLLLTVHRSDEGEPVLRREADLAASTNGTGQIHRTKLAVLRHLDAADRFLEGIDAPWRRVPAKGYDTPVPTLAEVLWWLPPDLPVVVAVAATSLTDDDAGSRFRERLVTLLSAPPVPIAAHLAVPVLAEARTLATRAPQLPVWLELEANSPDPPPPEAMTAAGLQGLLVPRERAFTERAEPTPLLSQCLVLERFDTLVRGDFDLDTLNTLQARPVRYQLALSDPHCGLETSRPPRYVLREDFAGREPNHMLWKFGYAFLDGEPNVETRVYQDDGFHIVTEEGRNYSGGAAVTAVPLYGDFSVRVEFTATNPAPAATMELGIIGCSAGTHETEPARAHRRDEAYDSHNAPPLVSVDNDEADGFRVVTNSAAFHFTNRFGRNVGTPGCRKGALRLDRHGTWFVGYYKDELHQGWVGCGSAHNPVLGPWVHLRLAAKHWRKGNPPYPANHVVFRNLEVRLFPRRNGVNI